MEVFLTLIKPGLLYEFLRQSQYFNLENLLTTNMAFMPSFSAGPTTSALSDEHQLLQYQNATICYCYKYYISEYGVHC